jgi:hypothetical protein
MGAVLQFRKPTPKPLTKEEEKALEAMIMKRILERAAKLGW